MKRLLPLLLLVALSAASGCAMCQPNYDPYGGACGPSCQDDYSAYGDHPRGNCRSRHCNVAGIGWDLGRETVALFKCVICPSCGTWTGGYPYGGLGPWVGDCAGDCCLCPGDCEEECPPQ